MILLSALPLELCSFLSTWRSSIGWHRYRLPLSRAYRYRLALARAYRYR